MIVKNQNPRRRPYYWKASVRTEVEWVEAARNREVADVEIRPCAALFLGAGLVDQAPRGGARLRSRTDRDGAGTGKAPFSKGAL